jgi:ferredoxin
MADAHESFRVTLVPSRLQFDATRSESMLEAALRAAIRIPSSCRNGTCRTCLSRLVSGEIRYRIEWPGLSADEKAQGFMLPCVACAASDIVVEQVQASAAY